MSATDVLSSCVETYSPASLAADIDLVTGRPGYATDARAMRPRMIVVWDTGDLVLEYRTGVQDTVPVAVAGSMLPVQPTKLIASGTTVTSVTIGW